jgi:hypothetical protein
MLKPILPVVMAVTLSACGDAPSAKNEDAPAPAAPISVAASSAATNPLCKIFAPSDLVAYVGKPLNPADDATGGCQWAATDGEGDVTLTVADAQYHSTNNLSESYQPVTDLGTKGYSTRALGGWQAGAIVGNQTVNVMLAGPAASREQTVALLKETVKRMPPQ